MKIDDHPEFLNKSPLERELIAILVIALVGLSFDKTSPLTEVARRVVGGCICATLQTNPVQVQEWMSHAVLPMLLRASMSGEEFADYALRTLGGSALQHMEELFGHSSNESASDVPEVFRDFLDSLDGLEGDRNE